MPESKQDKEFVAHVVDLLQVVGPVNAKRMFGGYGLYIDGLMFALLTGRDLYLKTDDQIKDQFRAAGLAPFQYQRQNKLIELSYFQAPEDVFEDTDAALYWGNLAYAAALRSATRKQ